MIIYPPHWTDLTRLEIETLKKFTAMPPVAVNVGVETGKGVQDWVRERGGGWGWGEGPGKGVHDCLCERERERERARARAKIILSKFLSMVALYRKYTIHYILRRGLLRGEIKFAFA